MYCLTNLFNVFALLKRYQLFKLSYIISFKVIAMDEDLKKLNPSVDYNALPIEKNYSILMREGIERHNNPHAKESYIKGKQDETFFKYFTFILTIVFIIIILNVTVSAYKMLDPDLFSPCRSVLSDDMFEIHSSIDNEETAKAALIQRIPGEYSFVESRIGTCGKNGMFSYHFRDGNTTYIVCDDETITHVNIVCREQRITEKVFISIITIL